MSIEDLIQSYSAIYATLDGLTVSGISNCKAIGNCATHVEKQLATLREILRAENEAMESSAANEAAAEPGAGEESA